MATGQAQLIRIGLLGVDDTTLAVARAVNESTRFELVGGAELDESRLAEATATADVELGRVWHFDSWESLLDREVVDAVCVARCGDEDRRAEQLRKLIQTGVPVLAAHPVLDSMLVYYELDMIRRDTQSVVVPFLPERHHPAVRQLCAMVDQAGESPIGKIEQVVIARAVGGEGKEVVLAQFARDVDLLRAIAGDMTRLGAMSGGHEAAAYAGLGVQMSGPAGILARWSLDPSQPNQGAQLMLLGSRGKATLDMAAGGQPWCMHVTTGGQTESKSFDGWNPTGAALDQLAAALAGESPRPDWVDAARGIELAETIDRSLAKGRTIELYYEDYTEEGTFKGTMTSIGCGLLVLGLCMLGVVAIAEHLKVPYLWTWPYVLAGGMGLFLLLQLLMLVFGKGASGEQRAAAPPHLERLPE